MLRRISDIFVSAFGRWMPDPLVIAIFLTWICFTAVQLLTDFGLGPSVDAWGDSYWKLLRFTAQMVLILASGHVLAHTRAVRRALFALASLVRSAPMAYAGLTTIASLAALVSWGVGLIVPAILSRIVASNCRERGIRVHFPLLVACAYCGAVAVSMQGISSSIPLVLNTPGHFLESEVGLIGPAETIFSLWSVSIVVVIVLALPQVMRRLAPDDEGVIEARPALMESSEVDENDDEISRLTPAKRIEYARGTTLLLAVLGWVYLARFFWRGGDLNLDSLNLTFVVLGLSFADSARHYLALLCNAARVTGPFLILYPLYGGMMGLIADSGLGALLVGGFVAISTAETLPVWTFLSAALLNIFIPSAGGQWVVQGPIVTEAALTLGADIPRVAMSVTIGESWTNLVQPIFAVPVLAIAGLHLRDIMGYCVIAFLVLAPIYIAALVFF